MMELDMTPHPIQVIIQGSKDTLNPIEEYCQKHKVDYTINVLYEAEELVIEINSKESQSHWHSIQDEFNPHYLNLEFKPPFLDQRWISRHRHRYLWPENDTKKAPISLQKLIKAHFDEHLKSLSFDPSFYQSKLYYSMLYYIMLEFIDQRYQKFGQSMTPVSGAYFELVKTWSPQELKKYQNYHLDTLQELEIIS